MAMSLREASVGTWSPRHRFLRRSIHELSQVSYLLERDAALHNKTTMMEVRRIALRMAIAAEALGIADLTLLATDLAELGQEDGSVGYDFETLSLRRANLVVQIRNFLFRMSEEQGGQS